jgi:hypothetical protein
MICYQNEVFILCKDNSKSKDVEHFKYELFSENHFFLIGTLCDESYLYQLYNQHVPTFFKVVENE